MSNSSTNPRLAFDDGTLVLLDASQDYEPPSPFIWDSRVGRWRAQAHRYRDVVEAFQVQDAKIKNVTPRYNRLKLNFNREHEPHPHQAEAFDAWRINERRGVVVLPTGSGKSLLALMAIAEINRSTLIVAPTIDLMNQWYDLLKDAFACDIGILGGGYHELEDLTVITYDSAYMHMDRYGNCFGFLVFDEVHHLPGESYSHGAELSIAPYRLGLTATLERPDGRHLMLRHLVGPTVYEKGIRDLSGDYLSDYNTERIEVDMVAEERIEYETARSEFTTFLESKNLKLGGTHGWQNFVRLSARSSDGRRAMLAYRRYRKIALGTAAKLRVLEDLLKKHPRDRMLIFTNDNETVYTISEQFLIPAITHQTRTKERRDFLKAFNQGDILALVTSRVLNEGVNVPEANVAIVLSGTGTIREHVQRLGRILRRREGKHATLYEVISRNTVEDNISKRRRQHDAYDGNQQKIF
ncbi:MAG: DEAD/DEAH box helicase family protein [Candidatus Latescibacteria bacterium]|jgi:superfamily II DNA or RNA helicase|nr:DEAD/DEAH box helicase family protein [Candidatus Latescibacterota bacterium]